MAWANGAALIATTNEMLIAGPDLPALLDKAAVSVFSCVPTQLSIFTEDFCRVRIIVLGGEAAHDKIIHRYITKILILDFVDQVEKYIIRTGLQRLRAAQQYWIVASLLKQ